MRGLKFIFAAMLLLCAAAFWAAAGAPYGLNPPVTQIGPFLNNQMPPASANISYGWSVVPAFPNLTFFDPITLIPQPGTNLLYVGCREGTIWFFENNSNVTTKTLFLNITNQTQGWDDCGILGMAFHPQYGQPGSTNANYFYVYYDYTPDPTNPIYPDKPSDTIPSYNRLSRFTVTNGICDPTTELVLINQFDRHLWHNGGDMFFGPDGYLYLPNGDEGGADDQYGNSQINNLGLFAGVFRIDVDQNPVTSHPIRRQPQNGSPTVDGTFYGGPPTGWPNSSSGNYYIPNDNPWVNPPDSDDVTNLEEFYAIGFRSPHRMTYDPPTGQIWLGDVGQALDEEVDLIVKGGNYQWAYMEGVLEGFIPKPIPIIGFDCPPVYDYEHVNGDSCVIGGYVYRGSNNPALYGQYIFGDNGSGRIKAMIYNGTNAPPTVTPLAYMPPGENYTGLCSFGVDNNNELYMSKMGPDVQFTNPADGTLWTAGGIYKLVPNTTPPPPSPPLLLSQTGVFTNLATFGTAPGLIPYGVNMPLWSDAAVKNRWIALPTNQLINFAPTGEWSFPTGTVFVKNFQLGTNDANPSELIRLETRLLVCDTNGAVYGVTYKWRADNSDADLITNTLTEVAEDIVIATTNGGTRTQTWYYPSQSDCLTCHNPTANYVLGVKTRQLNGNYTYPSTGVTDNQLRTWNHLGMFTPALNEANIPTYSALANITNTAAGLTNQVRSYLDANCAQCHRPGGVSQANWDARYDTPLTNQDIINGYVNDDLGVYGASVFAPGNLTKSIIYQRMNTTGVNKMPPLAHEVIDPTAAPTLAAWINSFDLPSPWAQSDVGTVTYTGDGNYNCPPGVFTVLGAGVDIWNSTDDFHYVYLPMTGDGAIVAQVLNVEDTDGWAKGGVMIRDTLDGGSDSSLVSIAAENGATMISRDGAGDDAFQNAATINVLAPYWVKLVRTGDNNNGYVSADGINWVFVNTDTIPMGTNHFAGLAVVAHNDYEVNTSTFSNVATLQAITTQPQSQTATQGTSVTFSVLVAGTPSVNYQWEFDGAAIAGATNSSYTLDPVETTNAGNYSVLATNLAESITSSNATLAVNPAPPNGPPVVAPIPNQTIHARTYLSFAVSATDTNIPPETLAFGLDPGAPAGAAIDPIAGIFAWQPTDAQIGTNAMTVRVTNSGSPPLSAARSFAVIVVPRPTVQGVSLAAGNLIFSWSAIPGDMYQVQYTTSLAGNNWVNLPGDITATNGVATTSIAIGPGAQFYRITLAQ